MMKTSSPLGDELQMATIRRAEMLVLLLALIANVIVVRLLPRAAYVPANLVLAAGTVAVARHAGLTGRDLGLDRTALPRGLRVGLLGALAALGIITLGLLLPTRPLFADPRAREPEGIAAVYESLVRIPFGTALAEEVLFRGVLLGLALRRFAPVHAAARNALVFGLWHILPAIASLATPLAGIAPQTPSGSVVIIVGTVAATSLGGVCLALLRIRAGSVIAPVLTHATLNVAAFWAARFAVR